MAEQTKQFTDVTHTCVFRASGPLRVPNPLGSHDAGSRASSERA